MSDGDIDFRRGAVRPLACYRDGWRLIRADYWTFFAMTFLGTVIAYVMPFGILLGPVWCGFEIYLLRRMAGRRAEFSNLFDGFQYFGPSAVPGVILVTLATAGFAVIWFAYLAATMAALVADIGPGQPPGLLFFGSFAGLTVLYVVAALACWGVLTAPFLFAFPLIVDRRLSGFAALATSVRALFANFWGVLGLLALDILASSAATFAGCIAWSFVLPLVLAADAVAYRQVFPHEPPEDDDEPAPDAPIRPAMPADAASTDIRAESPRPAGPEQGIAPGRG